MANKSPTPSNKSIANGIASKYYGGEDREALVKLLIAAAEAGRAAENQRIWLFLEEQRKIALGKWIEAKQRKPRDNQAKIDTIKSLTKLKMYSAIAKAIAPKE